MDLVQSISRLHFKIQNSQYRTNIFTDQKEIKFKIKSKIVLKRQMWKIWDIWVTNMSDKYQRKVWGVQQLWWEVGKLISKSDSCHFYDQPIGAKETSSQFFLQISNWKDILLHLKANTRESRENSGIAENCAPPSHPVVSKESSIWN